MKRFFTLFFILIVISGSAQNNIDFVNVFIGTDGTGHTFPEPSMPFGLVQPGPDNCDNGWNHTSGYQYHDTIILGYSQTRLSGTGINELGNLIKRPFITFQDIQRGGSLIFEMKALKGLPDNH